ncbi:hypothetical protein GO491_07315 [Flavobacteriaceae bacterium Ap0902]|nr:hypothetical protein [Flavobacteriaceae bacterium Ap0902]
MPNRPDGVVDPPLEQASKMEGVARKSNLLGKIKYNDKNVPIYLERIRMAENPLIWVFSVEMVEYIEPLYSNYKPPKIVENLPPFFHRKVWGINLWEIMVLIVAMSIAYFVSCLLMKFIRK